MGKRFPQGGMFYSVCIPLGACIWIYSMYGQVAVWCIIILLSICTLLVGYAEADETSRVS